MNVQPEFEPGSPSDLPPPPGARTGEEIPAWGHRPTAPCPACGLATHRHWTPNFNGPGDSSGEPEGGKVWIALIEQ
ncbi:hypothetical protein [Streptomyces sp. NPDC056987]|uniref:hypothetical protein n=1 Tax=Streptomyces sp. NPDC056987 TaxID=3345988 RepID=UPI00363ECB00